MAVSSLRAIHAQQADTTSADRWTPELSMRYKAIQETALSPNGSLIAYVVREAITEGEKSEYLSHIWVVSAAGAANVQYTQGEHSASSPAFSPAGTYLAFTSNRSGSNQIWYMRVTGGEAQQLTKGDNGVGSFAWSPDGSRIAFTMQDPDTEEEKKAKQEKRDVILVDQNYKYSHLYTITFAPSEGGEHAVKRLTAGHFHVSSFDWSPDGATIVFAHAPDPTINTGQAGVDLATVPADSGAVTSLVAWPGADTDPRYSPDGRWIAFVSHGGTPQRIGLGDLYVIPSGGGEQRKLAETPDRSAGLLGWSGDGRRLFAIESHRTGRHVFAVPVDGGPPRQVTSGDGV
jgi:Tol biopolymer transport system component